MLLLQGLLIVSILLFFFKLIFHFLIIVVLVLGKSISARNLLIFEVVKWFVVMCR